MKIILILIPLFFTQINSQEIAPEITMERKKLIILTSNNKEGNISDQITQIASSTATQLNRYDVLDRSYLDKILKEQKLQHSGVVNPDDAIEIGKVAGANEAIHISILNFGQKGVPTKKQEEKEEKEEPETGLFGWIVKEVVKAEIDKKLEDVERYPNNIQTIINGEVRLLDIETGQTTTSFQINVEHTGGVKTKSLNQALKKVRSQMVTHMKSLYQLSSEVLDVRGKDATLLLGKDMGVHGGMLFKIKSLDTKRTVRHREITISGKTVGFVEVENVSADASEGRVLRKWNSIEPGYQAIEQTGGIGSWGLSGVYSSNIKNYRLRLLGNYNPLHQLGGAIFGDIGMVEDTRGDMDLQLGFGIDLNYRILRSSPFNLGGVLSLPFDFHIRSDDGDEVGDVDDKVHTVVLPIISPRIGLQSELMVNSKLDIVLRAEYTIASINLGDWSYSEENEGDDESTSMDAQWDPDKIVPEIDYSGNLVFSAGIRMFIFE